MKQEILTMFQKLSDACNEPNAYSIQKVIQKLNLDYEFIRECAEKDEDLRHILKMCEQNCSVKFEKAFHHRIREIEDIELDMLFEMEGIDRDTLESLDENHPDRLFALSGLQQVEKEKSETLGQVERVLIMKDNVTQEAAVTNKDKPEKRLTDAATIKAYHDTKAITEQERIKEWRKKQSESSTRFKYATDTTVDDAKTNQTHVTITQKFDKDVEGNIQEEEIWASTLFAATGSANSEYASLLLNQAVNATSLIEDHGIRANTTMNALLQMAPKDPYEGMLISRLIVLNSQSMRFMKATNVSNDKSIDLNINRATKLMRVYNETLEALNRHRRKGEQRVVVQHVNVGNGGQAIVANEFNQQTQGGGNDKK